MNLHEYFVYFTNSYTRHKDNRDTNLLTMFLFLSSLVQLGDAQKKEIL